jgi:uncharacterized protein (TIGR02231 family)
MLCLMLASAAQAAVDSVVVYPGQASVTRLWQVEAEAGQGVWLVDDLPMAMREGSARLELVDGADGVVLGAVESFTRRLTEESHPRAQQLLDAIEAQRQTIQALQDRLESLQLQQAFLQSQVALEEAVAPAEWGDALQRLASSADQLFQQRRQAQLELRQAEQERNRLEQSLADLGRQGSDLRELRIGYRSERAQTLTLRLNYSVNQASWAPRYEWRLDTESKQLVMEQFAEVQQSTGEDWQDVRLQVSLSRPSSGGRLPGLSAWWLSPRDPLSDSRARSPMPARLANDSEALESIQVTGSKLQWSDLQGSDYAQQYAIAGRMSIGGDNTSKQLPLAQYRLDAELSARAVPRRANAAWLFVEASYDGQAVLPPGQATLFQDGALVGEVEVGLTRPGEPIEQSFGVDDRIEIAIQLVEDKRAEEGTFRPRVVLTRRYQLSISNRHQQAIKLTLRDVQPSSRDNRIDVSFTEDTPVPDLREVNAVPGAVAWEVELTPGESRQMSLGYRVSFPTEIEGLYGW